MLLSVSIYVQIYTRFVFLVVVEKRKSSFLLITFVDFRLHFKLGMWRGFALICAHILPIFIVFCFQ